MGDASATAAAGTAVRRIATRGNEVCAIVAEGRVACWNRLDKRMLVPGLKGASEIVPSAHGFAVRTPFGVWRIDASDLKTATTEELGSYAEYAEPADRRFRCTRDAHGDVTCNGAGADLKLPLLKLPLLRPATQLAAIEDELYILDDSGALRLFVCEGPDPCEPRGNVCSHNLDPCRLTPVASPKLPHENLRSLHQGQGVVCVIDHQGKPTCGRESAWRPKPESECINAFVGAVDVAASQSHACALSAAGTVTCCGRNDLGQLGSFRASSVEALVPVAGLEGVTDLSTTQGVTCALAGTAVSCFGGTLGFGRSKLPHHAAMLPATGVERVIASGNDTCALVGRKLTCFGESKGEHTFSDEVKDVALVEGEACAALGGAHRPPGQSNIECKAFGKTSHPLPSNIGQARALRTGANSFCGVFAQSPATCWGGSDLRATGREDVLRLPGDVVAADPGWDAGCWLSPLGTVTCWGLAMRGAWSMTGSLAKTPFGAVPGLHAASISVGQTIACAKDRDGKVACWSNDLSTDAAPLRYFGIDDAVEVVAGGRFACAVRKAGSVSCWGDNLGLPGNMWDTKDVPSLRGAVELAAGLTHVCGRMPDGKVACWGTDTRGEIGAQSSIHRLSEVE